MQARFYFLWCDLWI